MHIETAERYLREHIKTVNPEAPDIVLTDGNIVPFRESERLHRVIAVLQVVIDAHRPSIDRTKGFVLNIIGAISGGPGAIRETLRQVGNGLKGAAVVRAFTDAYMRDAIDYWNDVRMRKVTRKDWYLWDRKLKEACDRLAEFAGVSGHHCFAGTEVTRAS